MVAETKISDPYTISYLPRLGVEVEGEQNYKVANIESKDNNFIDIAISGSFVGTYILKPTPKLIWSHGLSPSTKVNSINVVQNQDISEGSKNYLVGLSEKKKHSLSLIKYQESTNEQMLEVATDDAVVEIEELYRNSNIVFGLEQSGKVVLYDISVNITPIATLKPTIGSEVRVVFHKFIPDGKGFLLIVERVNQSLSVRLVGLDTTSAFNASTHQLDGLNAEIFEYNDGNLLALDAKSKELSFFSLPELQKVKTISLSNVLENASSDNLLWSLKSVAPNRVLLSFKNDIYLLDTKYQSLLASFSTTSHKYITLLNSPSQVSGDTPTTRETFVVAAVKNSKENLSKLKHYTVDVGTGKLSDSVGKSLNSKPSELFTAIPFLSPSFNPSNETRVLNTELKKVYEHLVTASASKDVKAWEKICVPFLRNNPLDKILKGKANTKFIKTDNEFHVHEPKTDRVVDYTFIGLICSLISDDLDLDAFNPEKSLTYLLTHPLFPKEFTEGLLEKLKPHPRLFRQAIVTCPNIACIDLIYQLHGVENDEIVKDLLVRLSDEFKSETIAQETAKLANTKNKDEFDLNIVISKIMRLNFGYEVLNAFVDSNGLALSLNLSSTESNLSKLIDQVNGRIETLIENSEILTLVNQSLIHYSKIKQSKKEMNGSIVESNGPVSVVIDESRSKIDNMLDISGKSTKAIKVASPSFIPSYQYEQLKL
ncbi:hypothetical protein LJB42_000390 [Komagataella kurtzmanii]|nr:hypothetical protein LJB42_000390 [Komagataella kurtzmanii]